MAPTVMRASLVMMVAVMMGGRALCAETADEETIAASNQHQTETVPEDAMLKEAKAPFPEPSTEPFLEEEQTTRTEDQTPGADDEQAPPGDGAPEMTKKIAIDPDTGEMIIKEYDVQDAETTTYVTIPKNSYINVHNAGFRVNSIQGFAVAKVGDSAGAPEDDSTQVPQSMQAQHEEAAKVGSAERESPPEDEEVAGDRRIGRKGEDASPADGRADGELRRLIVATLGAGFSERASAGGNTTSGEQLDVHRRITFDHSDLELIGTPAGAAKRGLRAWLEDPWLRPPLALLVPLRAGTLRRAAALWHELDGASWAGEVLLVAYDGEGIQLVSRHGGAGSKKGLKSLGVTLSKLKPAEDMTLGGGVFAAIRDSSGLVPYDSAVIALSDAEPSDYSNQAEATRSLLNKRIKFFLVWLDPSKLDGGKDLMDLASVTGGEMIAHEPILHNQGRQQLLVLRRGALEHTTLAVPVDSSVGQLIVKVAGKVERAALYPPTGPLIDLSNATSVAQFSWGSALVSSDPIEATLQLDGSLGRPQDRYSVVTVDRSTISKEKETNNNIRSRERRGAGVWRLSARCDNCQYDIAICARSTLTFEAAQRPDGTLMLQLRGPMASVRETVLMDDRGTEIAKIPFRYQQQAGDALNSIVREVALPEHQTPGRRRALYVQVVGRDRLGESFSRMSGPLKMLRRSEEVEMLSQPSASKMTRSGDIVNQRRDLEFDAQPLARQLVENATLSMQVTTTAGDLLTGLQIGSATRLYGSPGETVQLHFEVTNYRTSRTLFQFGATSALYFLRDLNPRSQNLNAGQTINVIVTVGITSSAQVGVRDELKFIATGLDQVSVSSLVYVITPQAAVMGSLDAGGPADRWAPEVRHKFSGDCIGRQGNDCGEHAWSVTFFARDIDSGLLRMSTNPSGLRYDPGFVAGTKDEVRAVYRATCCNPAVVISAQDLFGNVNTYTVDASQYFTPATIAAISLGVILFAAILIVIIVAIVICVRRRRRSKDMPTYQGSRSVRET